MTKENSEEKLGILDINVLFGNKKRVNIEIQISYLDFWINRQMFYMCREYTSGFKSGKDYSAKNSNSVIGISILDFDLNKEEPSFFNEYNFANVKTNFILTDIIKCYRIELPKLKNVTEEKRTGKMYKWARLFSATMREKYERLGKECESMSEPERLAYLHREIAIMDENQRINSATNNGIEIGKKQGIDIGKKQGIDIGKKQGINIGEEREEEKQEKKD